MIIFGTRGVTTTPEKGRFDCPQCRSSQPYGRKRVRRFFTLYFIPVIPLDKLGEYIECNQCRETYRESVLDHRRGGEEVDADSEFRIAMKKVMALMCAADGHVDDSEIAAMVDIYAKLTGGEVREEDIREEVRRAQAEQREVGAYLKDVAGYVNDEGKEMIIKAAFMIAAADGVIEASEMALLDNAAAALQMTPAHLKGVLAELQGS